MKQNQRFNIRKADFEMLFTDVEMSVTNVKTDVCICQLPRIQSDLKKIETNTQLFKSFYMIRSKLVSNFTGLIRKIVHVRVEKNRIKKILRWYVSKATLCYLKQFTTPVLTAVITLFAIE